MTFILSTSILVGCGSSHVEEAKIETTPTLTPNPNSLILEEDNLYLGTPGAIRTQMVSTAAAADLDNLPTGELLSSKAVNSLVSISIVTDQGLIEVSGNLAYLFGHPVILTSGHAYGHVNNKNATVYKISVKRLNISNPVALSFSKPREAHIHNADGDRKDIGVIVITDQDEIKNLTDAVSIDQMLTIDDLGFGLAEPGEIVSGICYPSTTYPDPYPFSGTVGGTWFSQIIVEGALTGPRCSGGGLFDSKGRYIASVSGGYDFSQFKDVSQDRWNDTFVFPLSSIGKDGLESLINQAVSK